MKRRLPATFVGLTLGAILALSSTTPGGAQKPDKMWPGTYRLLLDTTRVCVYEVTYKPGDSIGVYSHPPHVEYVLRGTGRLRMYYAGEDYVGPATVDLDVKPGITLWRDGEAPHATKNIGSTEVSILLIELKDKPVAREK